MTVCRPVRPIRALLGLILSGAIVSPAMAHAGQSVPQRLLLQHFLDSQLALLAVPAPGLPGLSR